jgi:hypothetical protein
MSGSCFDVSTLASKSSDPLTRRITAWLAIAAAPTFAAMAIITTFATGESMGTMCGGDHSSLPGMTAMYLLMSLFHASPWLQLMGHRRKRERGRAIN